MRIGKNKSPAQKAQDRIYYPNKRKNYSLINRIDFKKIPPQKAFKT